MQTSGGRSFDLAYKSWVFRAFLLSVSVLTLAGCGNDGSNTKPIEDGGVDSSIDAVIGDSCVSGEDMDRDSIPDCEDDDANGDGVQDQYQRDTDIDMDGIPDDRDLDIDEDGIENTDEWGEGGRPVDTDGDGDSDIFDPDSDDDTILDGHEGTDDADGDGLPNFRDLDSDDDGAPDAVEAGDAELSTPPAVCELEIDPSTGRLTGDGYPDYLDPDSDNDGLGDGDEHLLGTNPCSADSDGDGFDDLAEGAYERFNCPDGPGSDGVDCGCASSRTCGIPDEHFYVILPFGPDEVERDLDFSTSVQIADIFFLTDITGSMGGTLSRVQSTVATARTGIMDRIKETIPDAWFGGGTFQDFPFGGYGGGSDRAFDLVIPMTPPSAADAVRTAWTAVSASGGADGPESHTEALFQMLSGGAGIWSYMGSGTYAVPDFEADCLDGGWGAPCFRSTALPIIIMFSDICAHEGPPGEDASCDPYTGIDPYPARWSQAVAQMDLHGAKFIGIPTRGACAAGPTSPNGNSPCYYMRRTAEATGSVDLAGNPLVYDLADGGASDSVFVDTVVGAVETVATQIPTTVDTAIRDDDSDEVDATQFIIELKPGCAATPPLDTCWRAPAGVAHEEAVAGYDESTFFDVLPGTQVTFRVSFRNSFFRGEERTRVFTAFIDVRGAAGNTLSTRQVFIIVPALPSPGPD